MNKRSFKSDIRRGMLAKNVVAAVLCCAVWLGAVAPCPAEEKRQLSPDELQTELVFDTLGGDFNAAVFFHPEPWIVEKQIEAP